MALILTPTPMTPFLPACLNVAFKALLGWPQPTSTLITWQFSQDPLHQICLPVWEKLGKVYQGRKPSLWVRTDPVFRVRSAWGLQGWRPLCWDVGHRLLEPWVSVRRMRYCTLHPGMAGSLGRGAMRGVLYKASLHVDVRGAQPRLG